MEARVDRPLESGPCLLHIASVIFFGAGSGGGVGVGHAVRGGDSTVAGGRCVKEENSLGVCKRGETKD
jgi:hypothetical protein